MSNPVDRRLFRLLGRHLALGLATGLAITAVFFALDVAGLRNLVAATREGWIAVFILAFAMAFTFGALAMGMGVMLHPRDPDYGMRMGPGRDDQPDR